MNIATRHLAGWPQPGTVIGTFDEVRQLELDAMPSYPFFRELCMFDPELSFQVLTRDNKHMGPNINLADPQRARDQWVHMKEEFETAIPVRLITGEIVSHDMVFAANFGLLAPGNRALVSKMVHSSRAEEWRTFTGWLKSQKYQWQRIKKHDNEGQGDVLRVPGKALALGGYGFRSSPKSYDMVGSYLGLATVTLKLVDPYFYHLDTCVCPMTKERLLYYPGALTKEGNQVVERLFRRRVAVSRADAMRFCCNSVPVGDRLFMPYCSTELRLRLEKIGVEVTVTPHSELPKSGGANACTTLQKF